MPVAMAIGTVAALGYSIYSGERAASQQEEAQKQSMQIAQQQAEAAERQAKADQAKNRGREPAKQSPSLYIRDAARQARMGGPSSTMLTGPQGINPSTLPLDRKTLLGRNTLLG